MLYLLSTIPECVREHWLSLVPSELRLLAERLLTDHRMAKVWQTLGEHPCPAVQELFWYMVVLFDAAPLSKAQARHARERYARLASNAAELRAELECLLDRRGFFTPADSGTVSAQDLARLNDIQDVFSWAASHTDRWSRAATIGIRFNTRNARRTAYVKRLSGEVQRLLGERYDGLVINISTVLFGQKTSADNVKAAQHLGARLWTWAFARGAIVCILLHRFKEFWKDWLPAS
jgi:hypothetical protein